MCYNTNLNTGEVLVLTCNGNKMKQAEFGYSIIYPHVKVIQTEQPLQLAA